MLEWSIAGISFFFALQELGILLFFRWGPRLRLVLPENEARSLTEVGQRLHDLQETLQSGLPPSPENWQSIRELNAPWGDLAASNLKDLRDRGGSLLPTIKRLRGLAESHQAALGKARSQSAQSLMQAAICSALAPGFGLCLYALLPGIDRMPWTWLLICLFATALTGYGALWMLRLADQARWGGLLPRKRHWILAAHCAGERLLALIRSGLPPDLAWNGAMEMLSRQAQELASRWGASLWSTEAAPQAAAAENPSAEPALLGAGQALRQATLASLMDGKPCTERIEGALEALRRELGNRIDRELALLPNRTLQPLFLCVAPAILGMLAAGLAISLMSESGGL